jgi:uncharacterized protein
VAGVLVEKAKTTPAAYPMTLNAVTTGCNQKSNRFPTMELEPDHVEEALERLREHGAAGLIQGVGRVEKFRHYLYDWLGVDKVELAVMAELLLRGAQTVGELRARASRMEPIRDLAALQPVLDSLKAKGLVVSLTPEGRGHVVTHALYPPREMEKLRAEHGRAGRAGETTGSAAASGWQAAAGDADEAVAAAGPGSTAAGVSPVPRPLETVLIETLRRDLDELRTMLTQLQSDVEQLGVEQRRMDDELRDLRSAVGP